MGKRVMKRADLGPPQDRLRRHTIGRSPSFAQMNGVDLGGRNRLELLDARGTIQRVDADRQSIHPPAYTQVECFDDLFPGHEQNEIGLQRRGCLCADNLQNFAGFEGCLVTIDAADGKGTNRASQDIAVDDNPRRPRPGWSEHEG